MEPSPRQLAPKWLGAWAETRLYARIGLPILFTQLCMMANGVVDTMMAGRSDRLEIWGFVKDTGLDASLELAGVAIGNGIWVSLMMTCLGLLFAATPMVAELFGAGRLYQIGTLVRRLAWSALALGVVLMVLGWLAGALIRPWMKPDTGAVASDYLSIIAFGSLPLAAGTLLRCYCEGMTRTRPITIISLIGVLLNIPLNATFIYGLFGLDPMGGRGCALATALVNWSTFFITLGYVRFAAPFRPTRLFRSWHLPVHRYTIGRQLRLGAPIAITMLIELSMFPGMSLLIAFKQLENAVTSGHQIAMTFAGVLYMFPLAIAMTATVRMGNLAGSGHYRSLKNASRFPFYAASLIAFINTLLLLLGRQEIAELFSRVPEVIAVGSQLLLYAMVFQWFDGLQGTSLGILRGLSSTFVPMLCIALSYCVIGIPFAYVAAFVGLPGLDPMGIEGLWLGMTVGLGSAAVTLLSYQTWFVPLKQRRLARYFGSGNRRRKVQRQRRQQIA